mmetsp:Transcript_55110/g.129000  ORF Transcript_55110/g.129000 Transcript_55110/m.129000 type:complete len:391 (+) Transcript_55110:105-1277(+)
MSGLLTRLLYPAPSSSYTADSFPEELVWIHSAHKGCQSIPAILQRFHGARYLLVYLHTNGEDVGLCYKFAHALRLILEVHVLLVEYPGYGLCRGTCSEESLRETAFAAVRFAMEGLRWPAEDIIVVGRSLGAALAVQVAATFPVRGAILISPFLSVSAALQHYMGSMATALAGDLYASEKHIQNVNVSLLVVHGKQDRLIPWQHGEKLCALCPSESKMLVCPAEMGHNSDLLSNAEFLVRPILRFFPLPDYTFVDMIVPSEAFVAAQPSHFHRLTVMAKQQRNPSRLMGDVDDDGDADAPKEDDLRASGLDDAACCHGSHVHDAHRLGPRVDSESTTSPVTSSGGSDGGSPSDTDCQIGGNHGSGTSQPAWSDLNLDFGITRFLDEKMKS